MVRMSKGARRETYLRTSPNYLSRLLVGSARGALTVMLDSTTAPADTTAALTGLTVSYLVDAADARQRSKRHGSRRRAGRDRH